MATFESWHDDDGTTFHHQTTVFFSQCDRTRRLSLHELLRLTSDCAVEDYRRRGISREFLLEHHYAILVSRVAFRFERLPAENERITVTTWEEKPEPLQLTRAYRICSESGEALVHGLSSWLLVDPEARRILPTKQFTLRAPNDWQKMQDCPKPGRIALPSAMEPWGTRTIGFSDLDANGHTNNARYGAFITDSLPPPATDAALSGFRINYAKEATLGQALEISGCFDGTRTKAYVVGKTGAGTSFESELTFTAPAPE